MKKLIYTILACLAFVGLFVTRADGSMPLLWTLGCIAVFAFCLHRLDSILSKTDHHFSNQDEIDALIEDLGLEEIKPGRDGSAS